MYHTMHITMVCSTNRLAYICKGSIYDGSCSTLRQTSVHTVWNQLICQIRSRRRYVSWDWNPYVDWFGINV